MSAVANLAAAALVAGIAAAPAQAADSIELERYLGLWHEHARTPNSFEDNTPREGGVRYSACFGVTAEYRLAGENQIAVTNRCRRRGPEGEILDDTALGKARVLNPPENTRLTVAFGPGVARFFQRLFAGSAGNYWIYGVGAPDADGRYSWAVVSGPDRDYIFVLSREADPAPEAIRPALDLAREAGLPVEELIFRGQPPE